MSSATAEKRPSWHALRPWLLLGGFVAVWWILSTGAAQADSTPRLHVAEQVSGLTQATPVRHLADHGHRVTTTAHHAATPVRDHVKTVSHSTVKAASTSIREVTSGHLPTIVTTPMKTLTHTATSTVGDAVPSVVPVPESSTTQGNSAHRGSSSNTTDGSLSTVSTSSTTTGFLDTLEVTPIAFASRTAAALGGPFQGPLDAPASAPHSASFTSVVLLLLIGLLGALMLWNRFGLSDFRMWRLARLPGGATYDPGSSPD